MRNIWNEPGIEGERVIDYEFWFALSLVWYSGLLFEPVRPLPVWGSLLILCGMAVVCGWLSMRIRLFRNGSFSLFCGVVVPFGLYTVLSYFPRYGYDRVMVGILGGAAALAVLYAAVLLLRRIQSTDPDQRRRIFRRRLRRAAAVSCGLLASGCAVVMAVVCALLYLNYPNWKADLPAVGQVQDEKAILLQFEESTWRSLTVTERLNALQELTGLECDYLGIPDLIPVQSASLFDETLSYYSESDRRIFINTEWLVNATAERMMDSLVHEVYHAYQHRLVDAYDQVDPESQQLTLFRHIKKYKDEFADYIRGEQDFEGYYSQDCEIDARRYAALTVETYYQQIEAYQQEETGPEASGQAG